MDRNGAYSYLDDPQEYKKARKRLQNRESAVRSRQRKKNYQEVLEKQISDQQAVIAQLTEAYNKLEAAHVMMKNENTDLKIALQKTKQSSS